jgi:hypothetical protein
VYDAPVIEAVESLATDERGFVLGVLASGGEAGAAGHLAAPGRDRCAAALAALARLPEEGRASERAALGSALAAAVPEGLEEVHPGWIRRALEGETSDLVRAVARGLPPAARGVAAELLAARGETFDAASAIPEGPALADVRRGLLAGLAPMPRASGPGLPIARALCALQSGALIAELDGRGAAALGLALAGAPADVVARAAAAAGETHAPAVLAGARRAATDDARAEARALVASVAGSASSRDAVRAVGVRAVARDVAPEGVAALAAVAQRLPPSVGAALLACAGLEAP